MLSRVLQLLRQNPQEISRCQALWLTEQLGDLAYWWLRPQILACLPAEFQQPSSNLWEPKLGSCAILFAQNDPTYYPALQPAFLLPLRWCCDTRTDGLIPQSIVQLAKRVCTTLSKSLESWQVRLDVNNEPKISLAELAEELKLEAESGWGWLAAGLILASSSSDSWEQMPPRPSSRVWISACWDDDKGGIGRVALLEPKVRCALQWGADMLFVPESQVEEAKSFVKPGAQLKVVGLPENTNQPHEALRPCLVELEVPPPEDADDSAHQAYHERLARWSPERARAYYRQKLLDRIIDRLRKSSQGQFALLTHLVTILSDNPELIHIAIECTQVRSCLILATSDKRQRHEATLAALRPSQDPCRLLYKEYPSPDDLLRNLAGDVNEFVAKVQPECVALDLTPGTKEMTLTLALEGARPGYSLIYLRHRIQNQMVVPFSEEWRVFRK